MPGGDFDPAAIATTVVVEPGNQWHRWDISPLVGAWLDGSAVNNGLALIAAEQAVSVSFHSSDTNASPRRPRLVLSYACECGVDCTAGGGDDATYCEADFEALSKTSDFDWTAGSGDITGIDFLPEGTVVNGVPIPAGGGWIMGDRNAVKFFVSDVLGAPLTEFPTGLGDPRGVAYIESGTWAGHLAVADKSDDAIYFMDLNGAVLASFSTALFTTDPMGISFVGATTSNVYDDHLLISSHKDGGAVYIVDQSGVLKKSIDTSSYASKPSGVAHLNHADKLMISNDDGLISIANFNGALLNQYDAQAWGFSESQGVTIHPETCEHIVLDKQAEKIGVFSPEPPLVEETIATLLMVVANENNPSSNELAKIALFEAWGYAVTLIDDDDNSSVFDSATAANEVVFVGEEISAAKLGNKLTTASIGVVMEEVNLSDEFGISTSISWSSGDSLNVDDPSHYITLPFAPGPLVILGAAADLADMSGTLAPALRVLASETAGPMIATLEAGGEMFNSLPASGRRVQLPWGSSNFSVSDLNNDGRTLLRRSLEWGVQTPPRCDADFTANDLVSQFDWMLGTGDIQGIDYLPPNLIVNGVTVPAGGGWIMNDKNKDRLFVTDIAGNALTDFSMLAFGSQGVSFIDDGKWKEKLVVADKNADDNNAHRIFYLDLDGEILSSFRVNTITSGSPWGISFIGATASAVYDNHIAFSSDKDADGGGSATLYIVDQDGILQKSIDVEAYAPKPLGVTHVTGADKFLLTDEGGTVSVIDFDGNLLHQYSASNFGLTKLTDVAINPATCDHVIVDKDTDRVVSLNRSWSESGGRRYVEMNFQWAATASDSWQVWNLDIYGVPENAVAEVAVVNADGGRELWGGVRAMGSTLDRRLLLHEAGGGGVDVFVMHVQVDSSGWIEHFSEDPDKLSFVLLGYWTESTYVERWDVFKAGANASWQTIALNAFGVGPGQIAEIGMTHHNEFFERQAGVRTAGSGLSRIVTLHEAKDGGDEAMSMFSLAGGDAGASVEVYAEDDLNTDFRLMGYWSTAPGTYTEAFADLGTAAASAVWEDKDLTAYGVPADAVVQISGINSEDGNEMLLGLRRSDSGTLRLLEIHEAKNGGSDFAVMHVNADASSMIEWYDKDIIKIHNFKLMGWWDLD